LPGPCHAHSDVISRQEPAHNATYTATRTVYLAADGTPMVRLQAASRNDTSDEDEEDEDREIPPPAKKHKRSWRK
jgi:hypothetical protein